MAADHAVRRTAAISTHGRKRARAILTNQLTINGGAVLAAAPPFVSREKYGIMGKIYGNFKDGIFYHCAAIDKDFTSEEWYKYCDDTRYSDAIVATYFGFQWNAHDVCLNPHTTEIYRDNRSFIEIKTAQRKDGLWTVGNSYQCLTGSGDDYGGGCGCWYDGETFKTEEDAILANLEWFNTRKNNTPKIQNAINKAIFDRKCKQLTLF